MERITPVTIPGTAGGRTTLLMVCHLVAPVQGSPPAGNGDILQGFFGCPDYGGQNHHRQRDLPCNHRDPDIEVQDNEGKPEEAEYDRRSTVEEIGAVGSTG